MKKAKLMQSVLSSNLRLLVTLRESVRAGGTPEDNPLLKALVTQLNLCGMLLPNHLRISKSELDEIRRGAGIVMAEKPKELPKPPPTLPGAGGMMILGPQHIPGRFPRG